jgi:hypothetical protein
MVEVSLQTPPRVPRLNLPAEFLVAFWPRIMMTTRPVRRKTPDVRVQNILTGCLDGGYDLACERHREHDCGRQR